MIVVRIGSDERDMTGPIDEQWINEQINRRHQAGEMVCIRVTIHDGDLNMVLTTPGCGGGGAGGRMPTASEREIFDLWATRGLNAPGFSGGNLVAFLKQLRKVTA